MRERKAREMERVIQGEGEREAVEGERMIDKLR